MMFFNKPKLEFVQLDMSIVTTTASCNMDVERGIAGYTACVNAPSEMQDMFKCPQPGTNKFKTPIITEAKASVGGHSSPQNIVGFDLTFDK